MTSGLQWDAAGDWQRLLAAPDWVAMTLGLPVTGIPGQTYVYNTGGSHVLGVMVAEAAGKPLRGLRRRDAVLRRSASRRATGCAPRRMRSAPAPGWS